MPRDRGDVHVDAVLFDLDGTLLDHAGAQRRALAAILLAEHAHGPVHIEALTRAWAELEARHFSQYLDGQISFAEQRIRRVREFATLAGLDVVGKDEAARWFARYLAQYEREWRAFPDVEPALSRLVALGYVVAVVTNGDAEQQRRKRDLLGLAGLTLVASSEVGASKPARGIFEAACARVDREPGRCAYVGDDPDVDARGANRAGLRGIWLDRDGARPCPSDLERVGRLTDVEAVLTVPRAPLTPPTGCGPSSRRRSAGP